MTKIKIHITKDILRKSRNCGGQADNCAFSQEIRELFPEAAVGTRTIYPNFMNRDREKASNWFGITEEMTNFIKKFDAFSPEQIVQMPELSFEIEIPDEVLEQMDISDVHKILAESSTMELVH